MLLYRKERRQRAWGGAATISSSGGAALGIRETDDGQGAVPGSEFLQVDFNKDKPTYKNKKYKETDINSKPEAGALTTTLV